MLPARLGSAGTGVGEGRTSRDGEDSDVDASRGREGLRTSWCTRSFASNLRVFKKLDQNTSSCSGYHLSLYKSSLSGVGAM